MIKEIIILIKEKCYDNTNLISFILLVIFVIILNLWECTPS